PGVSVACSPYAIKQGSLSAGGISLHDALPISLTVTAKPITVTADPQSKVYGSADPQLSYKLSSGSLEQGDSFSGSLSRDPGESVARRRNAMKHGSLSACGNYDLNFVGANLTIT